MIDEHRLTNAEKCRRYRNKKRYINEGKQFAMSLRPDDLEHIQNSMMRTGLDMESCMREAARVLDILTRAFANETNMLDAKVSESVALLNINIKKIYKGTTDNDSQKQPIEREEGDMLTPFSMDDLSSEKMKKRQAKARAKYDEQKDSEWGDEINKLSLEVTTALIDAIQTKMPTFRGGQKINPNTWKAAIRRMLTEDNRDPHETLKMLAWVKDYQDGNFLITTILGPANLRKQYDRVYGRYLGWIQKQEYYKKRDAERAARRSRYVDQTASDKAPTVETLKQKTDELVARLRAAEEEKARRLGIAESEGQAEDFEPPQSPLLIANSSAIANVMANLKVVTTNN